MKLFLQSIILLSIIHSSVFGQTIQKGNCIDGKGTYEYETGAIYEGGWDSGMRHGDGKMTYPKGVNEENKGKGPVVLDVYHQQTKMQVNRFISTFNESTLALFMETFDADNYYISLAEKVGRAYGQNTELTNGYFQLGLKQIEQSSLYSDEQKLILTNKSRKNYLSQLLNPNIAQATNAIRSYTAALLKKSEAEKYQTEADHIMLVAYQKLTNDILSALPYADKAITIITIATGEDLSGEQVRECQRCFDFISLIAPKSLSEIIGNTQLGSGLKSLTEKLSEMTSDQAQKFIAKSGISIETLENAYSNMVTVYNQYPKTLDWMGGALKSIPENEIKSETINKL